MKQLVGLICLLGIVFSSCQNQSERLEKFSLSGEGIGTFYNLSYYDTSEKITTSQIDSVIEYYNQVFSNYVDESELMRINASTDTTIQISADFVDVFTKSKVVYEHTEGAFDPSISPLVELWGFGKADKPSEVPSDTVINDVLQTVGLDKWSLEDKVLTKPIGGELNMSAIAKGYIVDRVADFLKSKGVQSAMVEIGGELNCFGLKPEGDAWRIGVNNPLGNSVIYSAVELKNKSMATSGNYLNFYVLEGKKYAHTLSPFTGKYVEHQLLSATVIADDCATADAYATAFMVLGIDESKRVLSNVDGLEVLFIYEQEGELKEWSTTGFNKLKR